MRTGAKILEALLSTQNSRLVQRLANSQKHVDTIRTFLTEYRFKPSFDIETGFQQRCGRLMNSTRKNLQSCQQGIKGSATEALSTLKISFPH